MFEKLWWPEKIVVQLIKNRSLINEVFIIFNDGDFHCLQKLGRITYKGKRTYKKPYKIWTLELLSIKSILNFLLVFYSTHFHSLLSFMWQKILSIFELRFSKISRILKYRRKDGLSPSKKIPFYALQWKPFKMMKNTFYYHLKSSFRSQDI